MCFAAGAGFGLERNRHGLSHVDCGSHRDIGRGPELITEQLIDSGLDEIHESLVKSGGQPNEQAVALVRRGVQDDTVWECHEPICLWKIATAARAAGLRIAYFDIGHKAPLERVKVYLAHSHRSRSLASIPHARLDPARSPRSRPLASIPPTLTDPARVRRSRSLASIPLARIDAAHGFSIPLIHCLPLHECRPFETGLTTLTSGHTTLTLVT